MVEQPHVGEGKLRDGAGGYAEGSILENGVRPLGPSSQAQAVVVTNTAVGVRRRPLDPPVPGSPIHGRAEQHDLEWNIASFSVGKGEKKKPILSNIVGSTQAGELTAMMGPSGSGKTTLMQCLSLRNRSFEGALRYNGKAPSGEFFTRAALVHQQELLFGFMTVREHLLFQAIARMSRTHTREEINARVDEVVFESGLSKCQDSLIGGNDGFFVERGLSGGERKRVAIATELLHCPDIIFLDEPTSGLDSVMSRVIVQLLRDLAKQGRIVMACVHKPSSALVKQFTHYLLLTQDGRLAFHGPKAAAIPHFESLGYAYPTDFNPADYLMLVICHPAEYVEKAEEQRVATMVKAFEATPYAALAPLSPSNDHRRFREIRGRGSSDLTLLLINCWRFSIQLRRDVMTTCLWGMLGLVVGFLFGILFLQQAGSNWRNLMGLVFSLATTAVLVGALSNLVRFPMEWGPVSREYLAGSNAIGPYLLSRYVVTLPHLYGPIILGTLVYWMTGMDVSFIEYVKFVGVFTSAMLCSVSIGVFASCISNNILVGLSVLPGIVTPMILFSGLLYQRGTVSPWLAWIEQVSVVNYTFSALLILQKHILPNHQGDVLLNFLVIHARDLHYDIGMIFAMFLAFNVVTYTILRIRMRIGTGSL